MRKFVMTAHDASVDPGFSLSNLAGEGRMDLVARTINAAFTLSHDMRDDVVFFLVLQDEITVRFEGSKLQGLNPDERSIAGLVKKALKEKEVLVGEMETEVTPGVTVRREDFAGVVETLDVDEVYRLSEDGTPIQEIELPDDTAFVLSDHGDFSSHELEVLGKATPVKVSPKILHADHAVAVLHSYLDIRT
ncbi:MAG: tRNA (pseudouridine(54)-N(1))-methyltransferase TrmY [Halobacteria archaeon]